MISIASLARQSLLLSLCGGAIGILVNVIVNNPTLPAPAAFDFPQKITLPDSSVLESKPLAARSFNNGLVATGRSYRYQHSPKPIEIEVRYIHDAKEIAAVARDRPLLEFAQLSATDTPPSTIKEKPGLGFYSLFVDRQTAYFSTCINPQGKTTVTGTQLNNNINRNPSSIRFHQLLPWLLGKQKLIDNRCLWTVISTPIDPAQPDDTMKTLETLGVTWSRWWQIHFPPA